jgi:hypothetical protein
VKLHENFKVEKLNDTRNLVYLSLLSKSTVLE